MTLKANRTLTGSWPLFGQRPSDPDARHLRAVERGCTRRGHRSHDPEHG